MASDGIDPATVMYSDVIYELVCSLYDVGLVIEKNEQRLFAKGAPRRVSVEAQQSYTRWRGIQHQGGNGSNVRDDPLTLDDQVSLE
jgi:hypothetical protein